MNDFLAWFLGKHWLVSAILFPEIAFAFAMWQQWYLWSIVPLFIWAYKVL